MHFYQESFALTFEPMDIIEKPLILFPGIMKQSVCFELRLLHDQRCFFL